MYHNAYVDLKTDEEYVGLFFFKVVQCVETSTRSYKTKTEIFPLGTTMAID